MLVSENRLNIKIDSKMYFVVIISTLLSILSKPHLAEAELVADNAGCNVLIHGGLAEPQPLISWPGTGGGFAFPQKTGTGSIYLPAGESLQVSCHGTCNWINLETDGIPWMLEKANVTCISDTTFYVDDLGIEVSFDEIGCMTYPEHTARRTGISCPNGEICEIGFEMGNNDFQTLMTACHDDVNHRTILVQSKILAVIDAIQRSFPRPGFVKSIFYNGISMANIYTRVNQRATLAKIVGSEDLALKYLPTTGNFYFAKSHLAAKADFIYGSHQRSTFYYLNTVPKWQNINAGNWLTMETNLRDLAIKRNVDLDIWTGSMGILTLADINGVQQEVHLYFDDNNNRAVPVPKFIFKVVREEKSGKGAVFISVNNPYLEFLTNDTVICRDICHRVTYLTWNPTSGTRGLSYCCEVDDFRRAFPDLPAFTTTGILE